MIGSKRLKILSSRFWHYYQRLLNVLVKKICSLEKIIEKKDNMNDYFLTNNDIYRQPIKYNAWLKITRFIFYFLLSSILYINFEKKLNLCLRHFPLLLIIILSRSKSFRDERIIIEGIKKNQFSQNDKHTFFVIVLYY